ncbi:MAG: methyl-accepting chemotaxis protein [Neomegalonema sp.]|nr:methyl-accepting chemotaxis protein [Neomegalonema sp.]
MFRFSSCGLFMFKRQHFLQFISLLIALSALLLGDWYAELILASAGLMGIALIDQLRQGGAELARHAEQDQAHAAAIEKAQAEAQQLRAKLAELEAPKADAPLVVEVRQLADRLLAGDLKARLEGASDIDPQLRDPLNHALEALSTGVDEALALADVAAEGDLSVRASGKYQGHVAALNNAQNKLLDGLSQLVSTLIVAVEQNDARSHRMSEVASELASSSRQQCSDFEMVEAEFDAINEGLVEVADRAAASRQAMDATVAAAQGGRERISEAVKAIDRVKDGSKEITSIVQLIASISQQSQLLSVNASVEAARAGVAGRGFGIVAQEISSLAARTNDAAEKIAAIAKTATQDVDQGAQLVDAVVEAMDGIDRNARNAKDAAQEIAEATQEESHRVASCRARVVEAREVAKANLGLADTANAISDELSEAAEHLKGVAGRFRLRDDEMVAAAKQFAAEASAALSAAVDRGEITLEQLFNNDYQQIDGSNPAQYMTSYVGVSDKYCSPIIEKVYELGEGVAFGAVMNAEGFLTTHARKFSKPQGSDPVWNTGNCRNRRFFTDRVGMAVGQSRAGHLLQVYRRDMGGGKFVAMKDVSAPIVVKGRHWGGFRIGYRSEPTVPASMRAMPGAQVAQSAQMRA